MMPHELRPYSLVDIPPQQPELPSMEKLCALADAYKTRPIIIGGVDQAAISNNVRVVEAIQVAGRRLATRTVFGLGLIGSRIKGYNTEESDIDVFALAPASQDTDGIWTAVEQELQRRHIANALDYQFGRIAVPEQEVPTDPEQFIDAVRSYEYRNVSALFYPMVYQNANLDLARLTALEIVNKYQTGEERYEWKYIQRDYRDLFLRYYDQPQTYLVDHLAKRYGGERSAVAALFSPDLFKERIRRCGLPNAQTLFTKGIEWFKAEQATLRRRGLPMYHVYQQVRRSRDF